MPLDLIIEAPTQALLAWHAWMHAFTLPNTEDPIGVPTILVEQRSLPPPIQVPSLELGQVMVVGFKTHVLDAAAADVAATARPFSSGRLV